MPSQEKTNATTDTAEVSSPSDLASPLPLPEGELKWIPLDRLVESPLNPRQFFPQQEMDELVSSMQASGYREWLPLMVRPDRQFGDVYEIGAGHRRSRAARLAGITEVPCVVRDMTDEQFLEVLNFDNSGRKDVHPLHEAAGWAQYMEKTGKGVLDIAARIGQSKEYVYQRLKYAALIPEAKQAFLNNDITAGHAILIARLPADHQLKMLKVAITADWKGNRPSVKELARSIQNNVHVSLLRMTLFDMASPTLLPHAGSCDACPKRTKNSPELVLDAPEPGENFPDECTDPGCFREKKAAHFVQLKASYEEQGQKLHTISAGWGAPKKGIDFTQGTAQVLEARSKGAVAAVYVDGYQEGKVVYVRPKPQDQQQTSSSSSASGSASSSKKVDPAVAKANEEKRKAAIDLELKVRRAVVDAIRGKVTSDVSRVDVELLLRYVLTNTDGGDLARIYGEQFARLWDDKKVGELLSKCRDREIFEMAVIVPLLDDLDEYSIMDGPAERLAAAAKRYRVDAGKIREQIEKPSQQQHSELKPKAPAAASAKKPTPLAKKKTTGPKKASKAATPAKGGKKK